MNPKQQPLTDDARYDIEQEIRDIEMELDFWFDVEHGDYLLADRARAEIYRLSARKKELQQQLT